MSDALRLAEALIACPSVTPSDAGTHALLAARLAAAGVRDKNHDTGPTETRVYKHMAQHERARPRPARRRPDR